MSRKFAYAMAIALSLLDAPAVAGPMKCSGEQKTCVTVCQKTINPALQAQCIADCRTRLNYCRQPAAGTTAPAAIAGCCGSNALLDFQSKLLDQRRPAAFLARDIGRIFFRRAGERTAAVANNARLDIFR